MSILIKGNPKEGTYSLIKTTDGWVLDGDIAIPARTVREDSTRDNMKGLRANQRWELKSF